MVIVHVCLAASYVEGFGYQENILTKLHAKMGHRVTVLTSDYVFNAKYEKTERKEKEYTNEFGVHVKVIPRAKKDRLWFLKNDFIGLLHELEIINPDIIFVHGGQFTALSDIVKYKKKHQKVIIYIDNHADYYNTPVKTFKQRELQRYIYGWRMRKAAPFVETFWGVTPWRCDYLKDIYGLPETKIKLLVMGGDDEKIDFPNALKIRGEIRKNLSLKSDDFVVISGGKIDKSKNIHLLMRAVNGLESTRVKLIIFGQASTDMESEVMELSKSDSIRNIGWLSSDSVYNYFLASDLAVFPGTHSVLWEQACAAGLPIVVKRWERMNHVDVGGNARFLDDITEENLKEVISSIANNQEEYKKMKKSAVSQGIPYFSYYNIAKKAIDVED